MEGVDVRRQNPYDWQNPVADPSVFAGREEEIAVIEEEIGGLGSTKATMQTIAILGARKVGKTSLLLRVAEICNRHSMLPILVSLEQKFASDTWEFWNEVLSRIMMSAADVGVSVPGVREAHLGFRTTSEQKDSEDKKGAGFKLWFLQAYPIHLESPQASRVPSYVVEHDLKVLTHAIIEAGHKGLVLMLDEAHLLAEAQDVKEQIRHAVEHAGKVGLVFAGQSGVGEMFTESSEPFYAHGRVLSLRNFTDLDDVAECALMPLSREETELMSPMTVGYLSRLSQGKPNQIRLICQSIYNRYLRGQQSDLNITIDVLDDVLDKISHEDTALKRRVDAIIGLNSVDLEILYNLTRYPDWAEKDVIELDESFRGEHRSLRAIARRARSLSEKRDHFVTMGLMSETPDRYVIAGGEFISLYLRFFYEIRKYGKLSRKLILGQGPATPFGEKCEKLVRSVAYALGQAPELQNLIFHSYQRDYGDIIGTVKRRFSVLSDLRCGKRPQVSDLAQVLTECFEVCQLIRDAGRYYLLCLSVRNLDNPRELMQIELYFDTRRPMIVDLASLVNLLGEQAKDARVLIEGYGDAEVELPDLAGLLKEVKGTSIGELMDKLPLVGRWALGSVQHEIHVWEKPGGHGEKNEDKEEDWGKWVTVYGNGDEKGSEECLTRELQATEDRVKQARLYNDRGYIRACDKLKKLELARRDLEAAIDLHHSELPLTLLNLSYLDLDKGEYEVAIKKIDEALLISLSRVEVEATYLRLRLPENNLGFKVKWEEHPANVLEASYINLAYATLKWKGYKEAVEVLEEGLELMPSSIRLKHALGRLHLHKMRADLGDPIYRELARTSGLPQEIEVEIKRLGRRILMEPKRKRTAN